MKKIAYYTFSLNGMLLTIPKKKGSGYLKSCFGFHSHNKESLMFMDECPQWFAGDTADIDGYLHIDIRLNKWDERFAEGVSETIKTLKKCFPHVDDFVEDDEIFWKIIA